MDQNLGKNANKRKTRGQKRNLPFDVGFREIIQVYVLGGF
jgi:hypothetical protein